MQQTSGNFKAIRHQPTVRERARTLIMADRLDARDRFKLWDIAHGSRELTAADAAPVNNLERKAS